MDICWCVVSVVWFQYVALEYSDSVIQVYNVSNSCLKFYVEGYV